MCGINLPTTKKNQPFDLEKELEKAIGKSRTEEVLLILKEKFKKVLPIQADSFSFSGNGRFDEKGKFVTEFNHQEKLFDYKITFKKISCKKDVVVEETFFHVFN